MSPTLPLPAIGIRPRLFLDQDAFLFILALTVCLVHQMILKIDLLLVIDLMTL